jgi:hypothetical protein
MSFPNETMVIQPEDVSPLDIVIIEDRLPNAALPLESRDTAKTKESSSSSSYVKLIESLAKRIQSKEKSGKATWDVHAYELVTKRIMERITKIKTFSNSRFVRFQQFPDPHYIVMTREQTVNMIVNDLDGRMRKRVAQEAKDHDIQQPLLLLPIEIPKQNQKRTPPPPPPRRRYGHRLIRKVCSAVRKGMSPHQAVRLLDNPSILQSPLSPSNTESDMDRRIRLALKDRFVACVRSNQSIFELANALLTMWGLPSDP